MLVNEGGKDLGQSNIFIYVFFSNKPPLYHISFLHGNMSTKLKITVPFIRVTVFHSFPNTSIVKKISIINIILTLND